MRVAAATATAETWLTMHTESGAVTVVVVKKHLLKRERAFKLVEFLSSPLGRLLSPQGLQQQLPAVPALPAGAGCVDLSRSALLPTGQGWA